VRVGVVDRDRPVAPDAHHEADFEFDVESRRRLTDDAAFG
jgi:hypothetical protein